MGLDKSVWTVQEGSQRAFLGSEYFETLYDGTRGPGKTDALLMSFAQYVGNGWGSDWSGWIFRRSFPELEDLIIKSRKWFTQMFPPGHPNAARYNEVKHEWRWASGERLTFVFADQHKDYWRYHGHGRPFIGWEELTSWPDDVLYKSMMSCCRSSRPGMPRMIRATTNPYGPGHNWVKNRFRLPAMHWKPILDSIDPDTGKLEPPRLAIPGAIYENTVLLEADPDYINRISAAAENPQQLKAWLEGSWDITSGGMFDDIWNPRVHVLPPFNVPEDWHIDRTFDWGHSKPFSYGLWAESDGSDLVLPTGQVVSTVAGDLFRIREWYGFSGKENVGLRMLNSEIAQGIVEREVSWRLHDRIMPGAADSAIFDVGGGGQGKSVADEMAEDVRVGSRIYSGPRFLKADKGPGSRRSGWQNMRERLKGALPPVLRRNPDGTAAAYGPREKPGLFICSTCDQWLRTVPSLPRDPDNMDDVNTEAEDHAGDETRYRCHNPPRRVTVSTRIL